jgi:hypothetical protein
MSIALAILISFYLGGFAAVMTAMLNSNVSIRSSILPAALWPTAIFMQFRD